MCLQITDEISLRKEILTFHFICYFVNYSFCENRVIYFCLLADFCSFSYFYVGRYKVKLDRAIGQPHTNNVFYFYEK